MGLSQTEFAQIAADAGAPGATRQSQAKYEKGVATASAAYMAAIASAGVDVLYILTGSREKEPPLALSSDEKVVLDYYRKASRDTRKAVLGALIGATD